jgi:rhodanese-related sulfurtransferase
MQLTKYMRISALFMLLIGLMACGDAPAQSTTAVLDAAKFEQTINTAGAQLVDVRTPGEYSAGHIEKAINADIYTDAFRQRIAQLDKNKPVLVYCASGVRSANAARQLKQAGFTQVYDLRGGFNAWRAAGKKVVR